MSINLTDEIEVKTKKGKLCAAEQIFLEGDIQTVENEIQNINSRHNTLNIKHESLSKTVQGIAATGGASTANNVTYNNDSSGLNAENVQDAINELQGSKIDKTSILQESGEAEDKVMSQKATTAAIADETTRAKAAEEAIIFDVSVYNNGAVFESLQALLSNSNLNTLIPISARHGGMAIRFIQGSVQSPDNKYMQYRLISATWSTTVADWQGVDDEPTTGSNNLVKSGGVANKFAELEEEVYELSSKSKDLSYSENYNYIIDGYKEIGYGLITSGGIGLTGNPSDGRILCIRVMSNTNYKLSQILPNDFLGNVSALRLACSSSNATSQKFTVKYNVGGDDSSYISTEKNTNFLFIQIKSSIVLSNLVLQKGTTKRLPVSNILHFNGTTNYIKEVGFSIDDDKAELVMSFDNKENKKVAMPVSSANTCGVLSSSDYIEFKKVGLSSKYDFYNVSDKCVVKVNTAILTNSSSITIDGVNAYEYEALGEKIRVTNAYYWENIKAVLFFDKNNTIISYEESSGEGYISKVLEVPSNCAHIVVHSRPNVKILMLEDEIKFIPAPDFVGKKWVAFGDSLTDRNTLRTEDNYVEMVSDKLGLTSVNLGVGGSGYTKSGSNIWFKRVSDIPIDTDIITLFGSGNDSSYCVTYRGQHGGSIGAWNDKVPESFDENAELDGTISYTALVNYTLDKIISIRPDIRIGIVTPTPWKDAQPDESYTAVMKLMADALIDIAQHKGLPVLDLYRCSQLRPDSSDFRDKWFINGDGTHPKSEAHRRYVYPQFREFVKKLL